MLRHKTINRKLKTSFKGATICVKMFYKVISMFCFVLFLLLIKIDLRIDICFRIDNLIRVRVKNFLKHGLGLLFSIKNSYYLGEWVGFDRVSYLNHSFKWIRKELVFLTWSWIFFVFRLRSCLIFQNSRSNANRLNYLSANN